MVIRATFQPRDFTRRESAKQVTRNRRAARRDKSARLFLALAFPAEFGI